MSFRVRAEFSVTVLPNTSPIKVDGVVRGFLVQVTNVTELKETQAALHRENQLGSQIEEGAAKLRALLQERTEMLDVLAHEVRQPLNNASTALQCTQGAIRAKGDALASDQVMRAQAVLGEVHSSIDNTLTVASVLARPDPIQRDDTDVSTLIDVAIADMPAAERGRIQVRRDNATRTAMDMSLMRLALRNLLSNALKFSPPAPKFRCVSRIAMRRLRCFWMPVIAGLESPLSGPTWSTAIFVLCGLVRRTRTGSTSSVYDGPH